MEDMDILIHPHRRELVVNPEHPYYAQMKLKNISRSTYYCLLNMKHPVQN
jgi:hypothetical protein